MAKTNPQNGYSKGYTLNKGDFEYLANLDTIEMLNNQNAFNSAEYCNIYIGQNINVEGFSSAPENAATTGVDGIVIDYHYFFHQDHITFTHEMGHWLGLDHLWGFTESQNVCGDDLVDDTQICGYPSQEQFDNTDCNKVYTLPCFAENQALNLPNIRPIWNPMDYSKCKDMQFTSGQFDKMKEEIEDYRPVVYSGANAFLCNDGLQLPICEGRQNQSDDEIGRTADSCLPYANIEEVYEDGYDFSIKADSESIGDLFTLQYFSDAQPNVIVPIDQYITYEDLIPSETQFTVPSDGGYTIQLIASNGTPSEDHTDTWHIIVDNSIDPENPIENPGGLSPATCYNGEQDGDETGVDCGGSCVVNCPDDSPYPHSGEYNCPNPNNYPTFPTVAIQDEDEDFGFHFVGNEQEVLQGKKNYNGDSAFPIQWENTGVAVVSLNNPVIVKRRKGVYSLPQSIYECEENFFQQNNLFDHCKKNKKRLKPVFKSCEQSKPSHAYKSVPIAGKRCRDTYYFTKISIVEVDEDLNVIGTEYNEKKYFTDYDVGSYNGLLPFDLLEKLPSGCILAPNKIYRLIIGEPFEETSIFNQDTGLYINSIKYLYENYRYFRTYSTDLMLDNANADKYNDVRADIITIKNDELGEFKFFDSGDRHINSKGAHPEEKKIVASTSIFIKENTIIKGGVFKAGANTGSTLMEGRFASNNTTEDEKEEENKQIQTQSKELATNTTNFENIDVFKLYPNPTKNNVTIEFEQAANNTITIQDLSGRIVYTTSTTKQQVTVDMSTYNNGVYIVSINNGNAINTKKLIKL